MTLNKVCAKLEKKWWLLLAMSGFLFLQACTDSGREIEACLEDKRCGPAVPVATFYGEIPLDPESPIWEKNTQPVKVELGPQMITNPKWPNPATRFVNIRAVHNGTELAILLEWEDDSIDHRYGPSANYSDQAAVMFPLVPKPEMPAISMGNTGEIVNIWQWRAIWEPNLMKKGERGGRSQSGKPLTEEPRRDSPVEDLNAEGFSTLTTQDEQNVSGKGVWKGKVWKVIFKRSLISPDNADVQFKHSVPMAVAVWNGGNRERNGQKGLAGWLLLKIE